MYKYINAYYIQEIDWVDYKGGQKGGGDYYYFFFCIFFRIFEIFFCERKALNFLWFFENKICYVNIFFCMNFLVDFVDFFGAENIPGFFE